MNDYLRDWNKRNNERVKLQYAYAVAAIALVVIAGLAGLVNDDLGQTILMAAFALTVLFFGNAIAWALLDSFVLRRLGKTPSKK